MNLTKNVGTQDRNIRFAAGGLLVVLGIVSGLWWLDIFGLILLATAYFGTCLAYIPLGVNTAKENTDNSTD
jgi:type IV secretory pathway TrbD component